MLWQRADTWNRQLLCLDGQFMFSTLTVDNTKLPCYTLPMTQHHSFFRNLPPLSTYQWVCLFSFKIFKGKAVEITTLASNDTFVTVKLNTPFKKKEVWWYSVCRVSDVILTKPFIVELFGGFLCYQPIFRIYFPSHEMVISLDKKLIRFI